MGRSPNVVHVITGLGTGGAERALYRLLEACADRGSATRVVALGGKGTIGPAIEALGIPVVALGLPRVSACLALLPRLRKAVREAEPDVVQGWMYHGNVAAWLAQRLAGGRPALAWNIRHSLYDLRLEKRLTRQVIRANRLLSARPEAIVYNSGVARRQHEAFGFASARARVVPNGFAIGAAAAGTALAGGAREALGVPSGAFVVGHVARLHPMKDHAAFLRAAVRLAQEHEDAHFVLSGPGVTADNTALTAQVPDAVVSRFHWLGERSDVTALMSGLDCLCSSSAWGEAFPNVLGEAMAAAVPCVATDVGDSAAIVADTGIIVPPSDTDALYRGLCAMAAKTLAQRAALGRAARERVATHFGDAAVAQQYRALYRELAGKALG